MPLEELIHQMGERAKKASQLLRTAGRTKKDTALRLMAKALVHRSAQLLEENQKDLEAARGQGLTGAMVERLTLTEALIQSMAQGLEEVAMLPDPVGEIARIYKRPNGLMVGRMRIPLGVIGFIYESRPNVTVDAAGLCLKSGNAVILKGGSEAINSNMALVRILVEAIEEAGLPGEAVQLIPSTERRAVNLLLELDQHVDLIIPRGGEGLIRFVAENSRIPVLKHYKGVCHVYVDEGADLAMAEEICFNAKVQRPGVCNAMETMLVHEKVAPGFLPPMVERLSEAGVEIRGCPKTLQIVEGVKAAQESDWSEEYLDLILSVKVVASMDEAIGHIETYGSNHTESIITEHYGRAQEFLSRVDSSVVLVNASTRFNDGNQLGLGAEIGISTSKLHAFGPMGLQELTTTKFVVYGQGQIRT